MPGRRPGVCGGDAAQQRGRVFMLQAETAANPTRIWCARSPGHGLFAHRLFASECGGQREFESKGNTIGDVDNKPAPLQSPGHGLEQKNSLFGALWSTQHRPLELSAHISFCCFSPLLHRRGGDRGDRGDSGDTKRSLDQAGPPPQAFVGIDPGQPVAHRQTVEPHDGAGPVEELPVLCAAEGIEGAQLVDDVVVVEFECGCRRPPRASTPHRQLGQVERGRFGVGEHDAVAYPLAPVQPERRLRLLDRRLTGPPFLPPMPLRWTTGGRLVLSSRTSKVLKEDAAAAAAAVVVVVIGEIVFVLLPDRGEGFVL